ncbi:MAG: hypothetical protein P4L92_14920 [Rudaea sp.]|nr:hypothetical protein [Rudaea sp.]
MATRKLKPIDELPPDMVTWANKASKAERRRFAKFAEDVRDAITASPIEDLISAIHLAQPDGWRTPLTPLKNLVRSLAGLCFVDEVDSGGNPTGERNSRPEYEVALLGDVACKLIAEFVQINKPYLLGTITVADRRNKTHKIDSPERYLEYSGEAQILWWGVLDNKSQNSKTAYDGFIGEHIPVKLQFIRRAELGAAFGIVLVQRAIERCERDRVWSVESVGDIAAAGWLLGMAEVKTTVDDWDDFVSAGETMRSQQSRAKLDKRHRFNRDRKANAKAYWQSNKFRSIDDASTKISAIFHVTYGTAEKWILQWRKPPPTVL